MTLSRLITWPALALVLTSFGLDARAPAYGQEVSQTVVGTLSWREMMGLTQDEIRVRLHLPPAGAYATLGYALEGDHVVTKTDFVELVGESGCVDPQPGPRRHARLQNEPLLGGMRFEDGRLVRITTTGRDRTMPPDAPPLKVICVIRSFPPLSPEQAEVRRQQRELARSKSSQMMAIAERYDARTAELVDALAEVRLGLPLQGGTEKWLSQHLSIAYSQSASAGDTLMRFRYGGNYSPNMTEVLLHGGIVTSITPGGLSHCLERPDRSLLCEKVKMYPDGPPWEQPDE